MMPNFLPQYQLSIISTSKFPPPPGTYSNIVTLVFKTPKVLGTRANSTARWKIWGFVKISNTVSFDRKASIYDTT